MQQDLDSVYIWADQNNISFNSKKFQAIRFAQLLSQAIYNSDTGAAMEATNLVKDLGVNISSDMHFSQHIQTIVNKGKRVAGSLCHTFARSYAHSAEATCLPYC